MFCRVFSVCRENTNREEIPFVLYMYSRKSSPVRYGPFVTSGVQESEPMTKKPLAETATTITLQTVLDRISSTSELSDGRKRDLRSAVISFAKLTERSPAAIPLDLAGIRETLDAMVPAAAKISAKRWANLRSDLAAAIAASGLLPMLKTSDVR